MSCCNRFYVDLTQPLIQITSPLDGSMIGSNINISGTAYDGNMIQYGQIELTIDSSNYNFNSTSYWCYPITNLTDGTHSILATYIDKCNQIGTSIITIIADHNL